MAASAQYHTTVIDRRTQWKERWSAYQQLLINRYTRMKSAQHKSGASSAKAEK